MDELQFDFFFKSYIDMSEEGSRGRFPSRSPPDSVIEIFFKKGKNNPSLAAAPTRLLKFRGFTRKRW